MCSFAHIALVIARTLDIVRERERKTHSFSLINKKFLLDSFYLPTKMFFSAVFKQKFSHVYQRHEYELKESEHCKLKREFMRF